MTTSVSMEKKTDPVRGKQVGWKEWSRDGKKQICASDIALAPTIINVMKKEDRHLKIEDIRLKRLRDREQFTFLFVVDASRSQGANDRLSFAKSAVLAILEKVYCERNKVGMILFGNNKAELVLPYTKSVDYAAEKMKELKAGGNTPLAMGLRLALKTVEQNRMKHPDEKNIVILITDGRSNYDIEKGNLLALVKGAARELGEKEVPMLVVDTENSVFGMGMTAVIAELSGGRYVNIGKKKRDIG